jgi:hypothetical protein
MQTKHGTSVDVRFTVCQAPDGHMYVFSERGRVQVL